MSKKNYIYSWQIKESGFVEIPESEYTERQMEMKQFIDSMSNVIKAANCGWDSVLYKVMRHPEGWIEKYMVLCVKLGGERWIPITGNSKGCNFTVLGENLW